MKKKASKNIKGNPLNSEKPLKWPLRRVSPLLPLIAISSANISDKMTGQTFFGTS